MSEYSILLPSKPRIVKEEHFTGVYEIDGLYPGYGHTLGNSLRRIILSSLPGASITSVKIDGISHEFSTIKGVKEDVVTILLNLKRMRIQLLTEEPQVLSLKGKAVGEITAADVKVPGQVNILNPELKIATITDKGTELNIEMTVQKGLGYVPKEAIQKERVDIGAIAMDAIFTPIRRVNYEVENMRVGNRTDFNRLKLFIETDGTIMPHDALEQSISIMINQLKAIVGFKEEDPVFEASEGAEDADGSSSKSGGKKSGDKMGTDESSGEDGAKGSKKTSDPEFLKTRIEALDLSQRTLNALTNANVRTLGGLARKKEEDILDIDGLGTKGVQEIKKLLASHGIVLK